MYERALFSLALLVVVSSPTTGQDEKAPPAAPDEAAEAAPDFDALAEAALDKKTGKPRGMEFLNKLWGATYQLESWYVLLEPTSTLQAPQPVIHTVDGKRWMYAFTDSDRLQSYAAGAKRVDDKGKALFLSMPALEASRWMQKLAPTGIHGVRFNDGEHGWFAPMMTLGTIYDHLRRIGALNGTEQDGRFTSPDGLISVIPPTGDGWKTEHQTGSRGGMVGSLVKCTSTDPKRFFFFLAKDYSVPKEQVLPAEKLIDEIYPNNYRRYFTGFAVLRKEAARIGELPGFEHELEASHPKVGKIHKLERVIVVGRHVILLSAEGSPEAFEALGAEIDTWFREARFQNAVAR